MRATKITDLIFREHATSDDNPPWEGMAFRQPVYSDEMFECLKTRYPHGANVRERKYLAAIEFLQQELEEIQKKETALVAPSFLKGSERNVSLTDCQNRKSASSPYALSSSIPSPAITDEPRLDSNFGQEIVFSLANGSMTEGKKRKKMTQEEKDDYRKTRKVGACDNCKRHKAKCKHVNSVSDHTRSSQPAIDMSPRGRPSGPGAITPISHVTQDHKSRYETAHNTPDLSQGHEAPSQTSPVTTVGTTPDSPKWREDIRKGTQSESSGYVPVSAISGPYELPLHSAFESWGGFDPRLLEMNYSGQLSLNEPFGDFPLSLSNGPIPSATYPGDVPTNIWSQDQVYRPGSANPS